jgi:hypothetical protein
MIDEKKLIDELKQSGMIADNEYGNAMLNIINSQSKTGGWIPCSEKLPENETEVEITYISKSYKTGETLYMTARAFYEDGTLPTEKSICIWNEGDNWEYDENTDSYIIPEGWFEGVSFSEEFGIVDMPVIAWRYLTEPYQPQAI